MEVKSTIVSGHSALVIAKYPLPLPKRLIESCQLQRFGQFLLCLFLNVGLFGLLVIAEDDESALDLLHIVVDVFESLIFDHLRASFE